MYAQVDKPKENKSRAVANSFAQKQSGGESTFQFVDNRPVAVTQRKLQEMANNNRHAKQVVQLNEPRQKKENNTGLPNNLKSGIENLSGYSMDDVKVHYNSDKPAQLQAHAYVQGTDIHLGPGKEKHLPHEAWHLVQQKQGRVKPTVQVKGGVNVNDDVGLEKEADVIGAKALQLKSKENKSRAVANSTVQKKSSVSQYVDFMGNLTEVVSQGKLGELAKHSSTQSTSHDLVSINMATGPNIIQLAIDSNLLPTGLNALAFSQQFWLLVSPDLLAKKGKLSSVFSECVQQADQNLYCIYNGRGNKKPDDAAQAWIDGLTRKAISEVMKTAEGVDIQSESNEEKMTVRSKITELQGKLGISVDLVNLSKIDTQVFDYALELGSFNPSELAIAWITFAEDSISGMGKKTELAKEPEKIPFQINHQLWQQLFLFLNTTGSNYNEGHFMAVVSSLEDVEDLEKILEQTWVKIPADEEEKIALAIKESKEAALEVVASRKIHGLLGIPYEEDIVKRITINVFPSAMEHLKSELTFLCGGVKFTSQSEAEVFLKSFLSSCIRNLGNTLVGKITVAFKKEENLFHTLIHECIHAINTKEVQFRKEIGPSLCEAFTELGASLICNSQPKGYEEQIKLAREACKGVGVLPIMKHYFKGDVVGLRSYLQNIFGKNFGALQKLHHSDDRGAHELCQILTKPSTDDD